MSRRVRSPYRRVILAASLLGFGCASTPLEREPWIEARSASFRFVSQLDAARTRDLVRDLELFQEVVKRVTHATEFAPRVPTTIVLFRSRGAYRAFAPARSDGVFLPAARENFALVDTSSPLGGLGVLRHEYAHYVMRNGSPLAYPAWYEEGFAELLRGTQIGSDQVIVGTALADRLPALQRSRPALHRLLKARLGALDAQETALFYAQSWLLVHYLRFGSQRGFPDRSQQLVPYVRHVTEGASVRVAARQAFDAQLVGLERELDAYRRQPRLGGLQLPRASLPEPGEPAIRSLEPSEVAELLGTVALRVGLPARAETWLRGVVAAQPDNARAHFGLARALRAEQRYGESAAHDARGLELAPDVAVNQLDFGQALLARVDVAASADPTERRPLLDAVRTHLRRAIELDPSLPEAHAALAKSYLAVPGEDAGLGLAAAERAHALLSSSAEITYLLALGRFRTGKLEEARRLVAIAQAQANGQAAPIERLARDLEATDRR